MKRDPQGNDNLISNPESVSVLNHLCKGMLEIHITHPAPKTACIPGVPHAITRVRLGKTRH